MGLFTSSSVDRQRSMDVIIFIKKIVSLILRKNYAIDIPPPRLES